MTDQEMFDKIESALHEVYMTHTLLRGYNREEVLNHLKCLLDVKGNVVLVTRIIKEFIGIHMNHYPNESNVMKTFLKYKEQSLFYRTFMDEIAILNSK